MNRLDRWAALLLSLALGGCANLHPQQAVRDCYHRDPDAEAQVGYCHALRVGDMLYVSGTASRGPMSEAVPRTYAKLQKILADNGLDLQDVVMERVYTTDLDGFIHYQDLRKPFYNGSFPAATWVQVQRLYDPSFVLEVEVQAKYPQ